MHLSPSISEISLTVAEEGRATKESEEAHQIEKCDCPVGYSGLSCEVGARIHIEILCVQCVNLSKAVLTKLVIGCRSSQQAFSVISFLLNNKTETAIFKEQLSTINIT